MDQPLSLAAHSPSIRVVDRVSPMLRLLAALVDEGDDLYLPKMPEFYDQLAIETRGDLSGDIEVVIRPTTALALWAAEVLAQLDESMATLPPSIMINGEEDDDGSSSPSYPPAPLNAFGFRPAAACDCPDWLMGCLRLDCARDPMKAGHLADGGVMPMEDIGAISAASAAKSFLGEATIELEGEPIKLVPGSMRFTAPLVIEESHRLGQSYRPQPPRFGAVMGRHAFHGH